MGTPDYRKVTLRWVLFVVTSKCYSLKKSAGWCSLYNKSGEGVLSITDHDLLLNVSDRSCKIVP